MGIESRNPNSSYEAICSWVRVDMIYMISIIDMISCES